MNPLYSSQRNVASAFLFIVCIIGVGIQLGCQSGKVLPGDIRSPASKGESSHESLSDSNHNTACTVCHENVSKQEIAEHQAYICSKNHCLDRQCAAEQIKSLGNVKSLETEGLGCSGRVEGKDRYCGDICKERIPLSILREILKPEDRADLDIRLAKANSRIGIDGPRTELQRVTQGIEDAFNMCCPKEGCGYALDKIEGCNAASCSNEACKGSFCYLCLKPQENSTAAHAHVKAHSGNYWEFRPGYTQRYHWLIARKKLDQIFLAPDKPLDHGVISSAVKSRKVLLQENNMWPMPAGSNAGHWIEKVRNTKSLKKWYTRLWPWTKSDKDKRIELLQNEYVYRHQEGDEKSAEIIATELKKLGGKVFASFDIKDAGYGNQARVPGADILPVMEDDPHLTHLPKFVALGNMYRIGNLIWSGVAREKMNYKDAINFCKTLGEDVKLPTKTQYEALAGAMGFPNQYNPNLIPDMAGNWFWSSSLFGNGYAWVFNGYYGHVYNYYLYSTTGSVRCVRQAAW